MQKMSDDPHETCQKCGGRLRKVLHPVAIHFKGSGFYTTDYGKGSGRRTGGKDGAQEGTDSSEATSSTSGAEKKTEPAATPSQPGGKSKEKQAT
jgi:predicted nucleic acid-binding Zn ribbon protein